MPACATQGTLADQATICNLFLQVPACIGKVPFVVSRHVVTLSGHGLIAFAARIFLN